MAILNFSVFYVLGRAEVPPLSRNSGASPSRLCPRTWAARPQTITRHANERTRKGGRGEKRMENVIIRMCLLVLNAACGMRVVELWMTRGLRGRGTLFRVRAKMEARRLTPRSACCRRWHVAVCGRGARTVAPFCSSSKLMEESFWISGRCSSKQFLACV